MKQRIILSIFILIVSLHGTNAYAQIASGLHNPAFSASGLAQGNAFVARANDASATLFNPAGLTQLSKSEISSGVSFVTPFINYHSDENDSHIESQINMIPNLFFAHPILENKLAAGIGITAPHGLSGKWDEDGFSRFVVTDFYLEVLNINPTISYKPFKNLSIGAGFDYYTTKFDLERRLNLAVMNASLTNTPIDPNTPEGNQDLDDVHGDGYGYNVGILYNITPRHSIGISFRSKADLDVKGKLKLSDLNGATAALFGGETFSTQARTSATLPEMLIFGYAYNHKNRWSIEADVQWTNWSRFDKLTYEFEKTNPLLEAGKTDVRNWHNTIGVALGGEYILNDILKIRGGYSFHETPVPSETFEPSVPQGSRHGIHTGLGYTFGKKHNKVLDFAYAAIFYESRNVNNTVGDLVQGPIDGEYDTITHIITINFSYKF